MFVLAALSYLVTIFAVGLFIVRLRELISLFKKQQPDPTRSNNRGARTKNMLKEVLGHTKMLNFTTAQFRKLSEGDRRWYEMSTVSFALATGMSDGEDIADMVGKTVKVLVGLHQDNGYGPQNQGLVSKFSAHIALICASPQDIQD